MTFIEGLFIISIGLWRVVNLLANEDGPWLMFHQIRKRIGRLEDRFRSLERFRLLFGYTCEYCLSLWLGIPLFLLWYAIGDKVVYVMAVPAASTVVIFIKHVVQGLEQWQEHLYKLNKE